MADDARGTITFHLTEPDPDFLLKLALPFAYAVPSSAPGRAVPAGRPGTGSYRIARMSKGAGSTGAESLLPRVVAAAHPDGYPDRIVMRFGVGPEAQLAAIRRGRPTGVAARSPDPDQARVRAATTRYASQVHLNPTLATDYVFLNTPPRLHRRCAGAAGGQLAVDRRAVARAAQVHPTCQVLPPELPGLWPYCPYRIHQGGDLARARHLVAASGTRGKAVTIWSASSRPTTKRALRVITALRKLGYRVRVHTKPQFDKYSAALEAARPKPQGGVVCVGGRLCRPRRASFPPCSPALPVRTSPRLSGPPLDAQMRRATALQVTNPQGANALWARIDQRSQRPHPWCRCTSHHSQLTWSPAGQQLQYNPQWGCCSTNSGSASSRAPPAARG